MGKIPKIDRVYLYSYLTRYYTDNLLGFQRVTIVSSSSLQDTRTMIFFNKFMNINQLIFARAGSSLLDIFST